MTVLDLKGGKIPFDTLMKPQIDLLVVHGCSVGCVGHATHISENVIKGVFYRIVSWLSCSINMYSYSELYLVALVFIRMIEHFFLFEKQNKQNKGNFL